jgi:hypothetical protein
LVVRGHQIKGAQPFRHVYGRRPGSSGESASHRFSRKTPSLSALCASNESFLEGEWAVSFYVTYFSLLIIRELGVVFQSSFRWFDNLERFE